MEMRKILRQTAKGLVGLALLAGLGGCDDNNSLSKELETKPEVESEADFESIKKEEDRTQVKTIGITRAVDFEGESDRIGFNYFLVEYNGMVGKDTFVLSRGGVIPNYYPVNRKQIKFYGHSFSVKDVNPDSITLDHSQCPLRRK